MEFPVKAETNVRVFDELSTCYWRIYGVSSDGNDLGNEGIPVSQLFNKVEICALALRDSGCLTCPSSDGTGLWVFSPDPEFSKLKSCSSSQGNNPDKIRVGQVHIQEFFSGIVSVAELSQKLQSEPSGSILSSTQTKERAGSSKLKLPKFLELTNATLYTSFISSIAWSISLHLAKNHRAIPLGKRTFFTVTDSDTPHGGKPNSMISTLDIETSQSGKVVISLRSEFQTGITQLSEQPGLNCTGDLRLHDDVWLAPTGTIARYIGIGGSEYAFETSTPYLTNKNAYGTRNDFLGESQNIWKLAVCSWIERSGIPIEISDSMRWIQVEIVASHQYQRLTKAASTRRVYWPAQLCFKKAPFSTSSTIQGAETLSRDNIGPLQYAHQWLSCSAPRDEALKRNPSSDVAHYPVQDPQSEIASPDDMDIPNIAESMARTIVYPDFQPAAVYPTPPGGALGFGQLSSDNLGGQYPLDISQASREGSDPNINERLNPNTRLLLEASSPGFGVGVGMYDTAGDDDLFEEIGDNFDDKEITEADFNFFDEPGLSDSNLDLDPGHVNHGFLIPDSDTADLKADLEMSEPPASTEPLEATKHQEIETPTQDSGLKDDLNQVYTEAKSSPPVDEEDAERNTERPISPPLSPSGIKRILFSTTRENSNGVGNGTSSITMLPTEGDTGPGQLRSRYDAVSFQHELDSSDRKYGIDGRFWFLPGPNNVNQNAGSDTIKIPTINELPSSLCKVGQATYSYRGNHSMDSPDSERSSTSNSSNSSISGDSYSQPELNMMRPVDPIDARLRRGDLEEIFSVSSSLQSPGFNVRKSYATQSDLEQDVLLAGLVHPSADWSLSGYFTAFEPTVRSALCSRDDKIHVAQLLVDQITQSSLVHKMEIISEQDENDTWLSFLDDIGTLGQSHRPSLKCYASISEGNQQMKDATSGAIISLRPPHIHIRRGSCSLDVLPTAIPFWETFGLGPLKGKKDIISYCLHPVSMQEGASAFLDRLGLTYLGANLGTCSHPGSTKGLIPWSLSQNKLDYSSIMRKLQHICENLGTALSNITMNNKSIVVYIVNPFKIGAATVDICVAFLRLFHKYIEEADKRATRRLNELVLQIIPSDFITANDSLVIPTQNDYLRLALEVYSRCPPHEPVLDMFGCAPAFTLAAPIPKVIPFRLTIDEGSPMDTSQPYHVAYSVSYDQRWVTAAWTDSIGLRQLTLSYSLREDISRTCRSMSEVRDDIWQTTVDMTGLSRGRWRVVIARDEPMDAEEVAAWTSLAAHHNQHQSGQVDLILLTVNTKPNLRMKIPPPPPQLNILYQSGNASTPVSTPKPSISSPDQSTTAQTPPNIHGFAINTPSSSSELAQPQTQPQSQVHPTQISVDPNTETLLVDKSDDAWALILSQRLNNSQSFTTYTPALANGYLICRYDPNSSQHSFEGSAKYIPGYGLVD
ncbi:mediator of RNA polymerase II transcription subunit 13 [Microsporum audouinii]